MHQPVTARYNNEQNNFRPFSTLFLRNFYLFNGTCVPHTWDLPIEAYALRCDWAAKWHAACVAGNSTKWIWSQKINWSFSIPHLWSHSIKCSMHLFQSFATFATLLMVSRFQPDPFPFVHFLVSSADSLWVDSTNYEIFTTIKRFKQLWKANLNRFSMQYIFISIVWDNS